MQHINPNSKRWDYSDIPGGNHGQIKGPTHMVEGGHHPRNRPPTLGPTSLDFYHNPVTVWVYSTPQPNTEVPAHTGGAFLESSQSSETPDSEAKDNNQVVLCSQGAKLRYNFRTVNPGWPQVKDSPTWLKVASTTLEKPPTPSHNLCRNPQQTVRHIRKKSITVRYTRFYWDLQKRNQQWHINAKLPIV